MTLMTLKTPTALYRFSPCLLMLVAATLAAGCATRTNRQTIIDSRDVHVDW